ncbi:acyltransferase family protein [Brevifollis gellanilyticus]|uniref:acyltransferase family protein n=1 Tax=Brevifollis gellanilyticus TaxID=748831 RepID=UPI0011BDC6E6
MPRTDQATGVFLNLVNRAYVGVSFFFVLSGFVLAYTYSGKLVGAGFSLRSFYARRVGRIYPAFFIGTLLHWPLFAWSQMTSLPSPDSYVRTGGVTLLTFSLVQSFFPWSLGQLNAPAWSVSVELFLYACFPWLIGMLGRVSNRRLSWIFLASLAACWGPALLHLMLPQGESAMPPWMRSPYPLTSTWIASFPVFHLPQFVAGAAAGLWVVRSARVACPVRLLHSLAACSLVLGVLILSMPSKQNILVDLALNHGALAGCFAVLFAWLALFPDLGLSRLLSWRPLVVLGDASYAMYILQMPVMAWLDWGMKRCGLEGLSLPGFGVGFVLLTLLSLLCTRWEDGVRPEFTRVLTMVFSRWRHSHGLKSL